MFLDIATRRDAETIRRRLPSMYHQFKELADVDITTTPMEVGPTAHYMNGGVRVDGEGSATAVPGLFAAGEVAGGLHGANRLGATLSDLLVREAGRLAARVRQGRPVTVGRHCEGGHAGEADAGPFEPSGAENPYTLHHELQKTMQSGRWASSACSRSWTARWRRSASCVND